MENVSAKSLTCNRGRAIAGGRKRATCAAGALKKLALGFVLARRPEFRRIEALAAALVQPKPARRELEALLDQRREIAGAAHARAEGRIVVASAAKLLDEAHHMR